MQDPKNTPMADAPGIKLLVCIILVLTIHVTPAVASITICTWNLRDFGNTKNDTEMAFIASVVKAYDVVAIQEVVAGAGGAQAVARLWDQLNRTGAKWDYVVSDPTSGDSGNKRERYAFLWKTGRVQKVGEAWLEQKYGDLIDREPFYMTLRAEGKLLTIANFHAITKARNPETEVKYFKFLPAQYPDKNLIFCGDFNLPQSHSVFNPLRDLNYKPVLENQKTSLRQTCINDDCLASEYDNIFFNTTAVTVVKSGVIHFYKSFAVHADALKVSDHVPVWVDVSFL